MPIAPEEMAAMQEQGGKPQGGDVTALAKQIGDGLQKLGEALNSSPATTDQDREKMAMVMNGYIELVEKHLGGAGPGQDPEQEDMRSGEIPMEGGRTGVPAGPQSKM